MKWLKFKYYCFVTFAYLFIFGCIGFSAWINHREIEAIFLFVAYLMLRYAFPKTFHSKSFYRCIFYTIVMFWVAIPMVLPLCVSIFSSIAVGWFIGFVLYKLQDYIDHMQAKFKRKTIYDLTKEELYALMENSTLSEEEKDAVEYRVIYHYKGKRWYQAVGYSKRQCQYLIKYAVEKLNNLINQ